jgi:beta-ribofuranosylaminobenzene 5'-phosphate synthase
LIKTVHGLVSLMVSNSKEVSSHIRVNAFARLHMGFLDLNGTQGRRFGSIGLGINAPDTLIELAIGQHIFEQKHEAEYIQKYKKAILDYANISQHVSIKVHREIPRHFGLGSGTQMALAIGRGISQLFNLNLTSSEIAYIVGRGLRSGIGIGTFDVGGFVVDGGRGSETKVPPIILQKTFPEQWRVLLIFDHQHVGVHGAEEVEAFARLKDASLAQTEMISHQVMMGALPSLIEEDLNGFGKAIAALQAYTGDYFAPVQGGRYASESVTKVLNYLKEHDVLCSGQSSWGPTAFAIFESEPIAQTFLKNLSLRFKSSALSFLICTARNVGATVEIKNKP